MMATTLEPQQASLHRYWRTLPFSHKQVLGADGRPAGRQVPSSQAAAVAKCISANKLMHDVNASHQDKRVQQGGEGQAGSRLTCASEDDGAGLAHLHS